MKFWRQDGQRLRMPVAAEDCATMSSIELAGQHSCSRPPSWPSGPAGADLNSSREGHMPRIAFSRTSSIRGTER